VKPVQQSVFQSVLDRSSLRLNTARLSWPGAEMPTTCRDFGTCSLARANRFQLAHWFRV